MHYTKTKFLAASALIAEKEGIMQALLKNYEETLTG